MPASWAQRVSYPREQRGRNCCPASGVLPWEEARGRRGRFARLSVVQRQKRLRSMIEVRFTPREKEVLRAITQGFSNEGVAKELKINIETVKQHVKHILKKLHGRGSDPSRVAGIAIESC